MINEFKGEYWFLSNFADIPAAYRNVWYPTAEHAFQAAKTQDAGERSRIRAASSPGEAKRLGRRVSLRPRWDDMRRQVMYEVLGAKFSDPVIKKLLLATGQEQLVEGNSWHDNFWGSCTCAKCGNRGKNVLGVLREEQL